MDLGFPKAVRLLKRREFRTVYDIGTPYRNAGFHLFVLERGTCAPTRIGLTASRRVGGAVARNHLRRRAREAFRRLRSEIQPGRDIVVNFHASLAGAPREKFDRLFKDVLIPAGEEAEAKTGDIVVARISAYGDQKLNPLGEVERARPCLQQSLAIFEEIRSPDADRVRRWLDELENS